MRDADQPYAAVETRAMRAIPPPLRSRDVRWTSIHPQHPHGAASTQGTGWWTGADPGTGPRPATRCPSGDGGRPATSPRLRSGNALTDFHPHETSTCGGHLDAGSELMDFHLHRRSVDGPCRLRQPARHHFGSQRLAPGVQRVAGNIDESPAEALGLQPQIQRAVQVVDVEVAPRSGTQFRGGP